MILTNGEKLNVVFRVEGKLPKTNLSKYEVRITENGSMITGDIEEDSKLLEEIHNVTNAIGNQKFPILLSKKYQIVLKDEERAFDAIQNLFSPNFKVDNFCLSRCSFFVDKTDIYSVDLDYDFEDKLDVEIYKFIEDNENDDEIKRFPISAKSIVDDIIGGLEEGLL